MTIQAIQIGGNRGKRKPSPKLKPCPFCGGKATFVIKKPKPNDPVENLLFPDGCFRVACRNAGCWNSGPLPNNWYGVKEEAAEVWNRRPAND